MGRIPPLKPEDLGPEARAALEEIRTKRGEMATLLATMAHRPALMTTLAAHLSAVFETGTVEPRLKEMLAVRVSQINDCGY
jgi:alkylhydroperoxidase family enzyme